MFTDFTDYLSKRITGNDQFAFTAIITDTGAGIGVAYQDMAGHYTISNTPTFKAYPEAQDYADKLNTDMGLSTLEAWKIIASSMRHQYS